LFFAMVRQTTYHTVTAIGTQDQLNPVRAGDESDLQQPDDLGTSLTSAQGHDVASDALVEKSSLILVSLLGY